MTTVEMVNLIRANNQPLSHKALRAIADRLEEQDAYLRSALCTLENQEEQLRGLGGELAESERHRQMLTAQGRELLARCDLLEAELAEVG
jgi:chromosome segregation ATPase